MRPLIAVLVFVVLHLPLGAQNAPGIATLPPVANLRGLSIGIDPLVYAQLTSDDITGGQASGGMGLQLRFGWGFTERIALTMDVSVTQLVLGDTAEYFLDHGDVLLRYTPFVRRGPLGVWAPFVNIGLGLRDIDAISKGPSGTSIYEFSGEVLTFGAGTSLYLRPRIAIFLAGYASTGDFNDERIGNTTTHSRGVAGTSSRVVLGATWHKGR